MKNVCYALLVLLSITAIGCKEQIDFNKIPGGLIAQESNGTIEFEIDTTGYKEFLAGKLFQDKKVTFDKIEIRKQKALVSGQEFYLLFLKSDGSKIRVARYLIKKGNGFYINDTITGEDMFEQICVACTGGDGCAPEAFIDNGERMWSCSKTIACPVDDKKPECISQQTLMADIE